MNIALAVFVKTPGLSPIKTRLARSTSEDFADTFYKKSLKATSAFLQSIKEKVDGVDTYWAVAEEQGLKSEYWSHSKKIYQGVGDLGMRLHKVYSELNEEYDAVFFMGADSPHLSSVYISEKVRYFMNTKSSDFLLGSTIDGGYYFFGGKSQLASSAWLNVRYSSLETSSDFSKNLIANGTLVSINESFDIDEKLDLAHYSSKEFFTQDLVKEQMDLINWVRESSNQ